MFSNIYSSSVSHKISTFMSSSSFLSIKSCHFNKLVDNMRRRTFTNRTLGHDATAHQHRIGFSRARAIFVKENIPPIALIVGCVALTFQIGVLYPWHEVLSEEFTELQNISKSVQSLAADLDKKMDTVVKLEEEVKAKERKVLDHEVEILETQREILKVSAELNMKLDRVMMFEEEVKEKERKVLEREEEILQTEKLILERIDQLQGTLAK